MKLGYLTQKDFRSINGKTMNFQFRNHNPVSFIKSVIKYEDRITQPLSVICSYIYYTTTRFGQIVRPSSGSLKIHIK